MSKMREDLGICFRHKFVSFGLKPVIQFLVVLNNSIVDDRDISRNMGMRIDCGWRALGCPASVPDTACSFHIRKFCFKVSYLPSVLHTDIPLSVNIATPAESYPLYSSLFKASISMGVACLVPTYPTIPHIFLPQRTVEFGGMSFVTLTPGSTAHPVAIIFPAFTSTDGPMILLSPITVPSSSAV